MEWRGGDFGVRREFGSATERVKEGRREIQIHGRGATPKITLERVA